jgi:hypothetical protein
LYIIIFSQNVNRLIRVAHNVPAVWMGLARQSEGFGGPDKEMRSISGTDKLWVEQRCRLRGNQKVGMERSGMT